MAFPFSIEGSLVVDIDTAAKASRVMDGVERWLVAQQARDFALSSSPLQVGEVLVWLIFGMLLARVSVLLALAVVMAVAPLITYVSWRMTQYTGRSELRHAAIRGLADGAARELVDLQARSHSRI
jgi:uncharacterized membrane protein YedE/YeeE